MSFDRGNKSKKFLLSLLMDEKLPKCNTREKDTEDYFMNKEQHPIYRSSMGGTAYFKVMEYKPYEPEQISVENEKSIVTNVKPLSTTSEKRLSAFVILKIEASTDELVSITNEISESIKYANVYSIEKSAVLHANMPAKAVWCYFGMDENDMVNHTHDYYTIWAADDVKNKYYKEIRDCVEEIMQLLGCILDLSIYLEGDKQDGAITDREEWLIQNTIKKYNESLEKLKELETSIK